MGNTGTFHSTADDCFLGLIGQYQESVTHWMDIFENRLRENISASHHPTPEGKVGKRNGGLMGGGDAFSKRLVSIGKWGGGPTTYPGLMREQPLWTGMVLHGRVGFAHGDPLAHFLEHGSSKHPGRQYMYHTYQQVIDLILSNSGARP